jgi:hypothetical protein
MPVERLSASVLHKSHTDLALEKGLCNEISVWLAAVVPQGGTGVITEYQ